MVDRGQEKHCARESVVEHDNVNRQLYVSRVHLLAVRKQAKYWQLRCFGGWGTEGRNHRVALGRCEIRHRSVARWRLHLFLRVCKRRLHLLFAQLEGTDTNSEVETRNLSKIRFRL